MKPMKEATDDDTPVTEEKSQSHIEYSEAALKIKDSDWRQLRCETTKLVYGTFWVKCVFICVFAIFIPIGILTYNVSQSVVYQEFDAYSSVEDCSLEGFSGEASWGKECTVTYTVNDRFEPPIYFYYRLENVYQNHRSYVKSRTEAQLQGEDASDVDDCSPLKKFKDSKLLPCGLIAYSFFNDKYKVTHISGTDGTRTELCPSTDAQCVADEKSGDWSDNSWHSDPNWSREHIAWHSDVDEKFGATEVKSGLTNIGQLQNWQNVTMPDTDDPDLIVWMRTATDNQFTKLHRIINDITFDKGDDLEITIRNYFEVSNFDGKKSLVISTVSALGGRNDVLGIGFMVMGALSLLACVFIQVTIPQNRLVPHDLPETELAITYSNHK